jgi:hypothetical protein
MVHFDKVIGASTLILGLFSVGGMLSTDAYVHGAKVQAKSDYALTKMIANDGSKVCLNDVAPVNAGDAASAAVTSTQTAAQ